MNIALVCGGPSRERGISLNSARSFLDHTKPLAIELVLFYLHPSRLFYELSPADLYSNTPADFDFKLSSCKQGLTEEQFLQRLKGIDLVYPLIHGRYGEDGELQKRLEEHKIPFAGSSSASCKRMFNKYLAHEWLKKQGFSTLPALLLPCGEKELKSFWHEQKIKRAIIKPTCSGSSIGVKIIHSIEEAKEAVQHLLQEGFDELLLEPYSEEREFTICVLGKEGKAVSLIPLEIDHPKGGIFDYRKKYLPSLETRYYCPPRFSPKIVSNIRKEAERLFDVFEVEGCARLDGWVSSEGHVRFSDLNPVSGMEQNSFLFQQAARVGLSHTDLLEYLLQEAFAKYQKSGPKRREEPKKSKKPVFVLMGGETSEKQVSLLSGTNVWLKLLQTVHYAPSLFLLSASERVWQIPYDFALHHTVEEMIERCETAKDLTRGIEPLVQEIRDRLSLPSQKAKQIPSSMSLRSFLDLAKRQKAFVFLGLHGGKGEDGTLQRKLESKGIFFNGSKAMASKTCMDKQKTAAAIEKIKKEGIFSMPQISILVSENSQAKSEAIWKRAAKKLQTNDLLIKPQKDGCSTGVVRLKSPEELALYFELIVQKAPRAPAHVFSHHPTPVEMPVGSNRFLLEPFIKTDTIYALDTKLQYEKITGWCEMTIGVLEAKGIYRALNPSLTLAAHHILSVEEKFQGGTGINITPPPSEILSEEARKKVQHRAAEVAKALGIEGYARLDLFVECETGNIRVIEANTLPALTPSTVLYHQALAESPPIFPQELLIQILESK